MHTGINIRSAEEILNFKESIINALKAKVIVTNDDKHHALSLLHRRQLLEWVLGSFWPFDEFEHLMIQSSLISRALDNTCITTKQTQNKQLGASKYFITANGVIHTIYSNGKSTCPDKFQIIDKSHSEYNGFESVRILKQSVDNDEIEITEEYDLWPSLTELANAIETSPSYLKQNTL